MFNLGFAMILKIFFGFSFVLLSGLNSGLNWVNGPTPAIRKGRGRIKDERPQRKRRSKRGKPLKREGVKCLKK